MNADAGAAARKRRLVESLTVRLREEEKRYVLPPRRLLAVAVLNLVLLALVLFLYGCAGALR